MDENTDETTGGTTGVNEGGTTTVEVLSSGQGVLELSTTGGVKIEVTTAGGAVVVSAGGVNKLMEVDVSSQGVVVDSAGTTGVVVTTTG